MHKYYKFYIASLSSFGLVATVPPHSVNDFPAISAMAAASAMMIWMFFIFKNLMLSFYRGLYSTAEILYRIIFLIVNIVFFYAALYRIAGLKIGEAFVDTPSIVDAIYFSTITWTTTGYGDLVAVGYARLLAASEALVGYVAMALLIAVLIKTLETTRSSN